MKRLFIFFADLRALLRQAWCVLRRSHVKLVSVGHLTRHKGGFAPVPLAQCMFCGTLIMIPAKPPVGTRKL